MSLIAKETVNFTSVMPGTYPARCVRLIDVGTQETDFAGEKKKIKQVIISWELPTELIEIGDYAGQPYMVSKFFTNSLHKEASLRKALESWRDRTFTEQELGGFNLRNVLNKCCMLSIVHNDKGNAKVGAVMALMKGVIVPDRINPLVEFDIDSFNAETFDSLTDGIKNIIKRSAEYKYGNQHIENSPEEYSSLEAF